MLKEVLNRIWSRESGLLLATLLFFFVSGASGLLYQVVWTRKLVLLFGTTSYAVSTVLSIFFLGLGLGSLWGGRLADRTTRPLVVYAAMEIAIAVWAIVFILLIDSAEGAVVSLLRGAGNARVLGIIARGALATGFLIVPVTLMGATLPLLARCVTMAGPVRGFRVGALYTLNTCGAVAGCAATGFLLLAELGYTRTTLVGAVANGVVGLLALLLGGILGRSGSDSADESVPTTAPAALSPQISPAVSRIVVAAFAVSGFVCLALEVVWTRLLVIVFTGTTYAFTTMLTTVLCGIAAGSAVASLAADRIRHRVAAFGAVQLLTAVSCLLMLAVFPTLPGRMDQMLFEGGYSWDKSVTSRFVLSFLVLFVPTFFFGMSFPLAFRVVADRRENVGRDLGHVYAANTFGGVAGSLCAGFLLIPLVGAHNSVVGLSLLLLLAGVVLVLASPACGRARKAFWIGGGLVATAWSLTLLPADVSRSFNDWIVPEDHEVLYYSEGVEGTVMVSGPLEEVHGSERVLWINAVQATASIEKGVKMNRFQGVLPLMFDQDLDTALFMCFGSGVTAGTLSMGEVGHIDAVEISRDVLAAAGYFEKDNYGIRDNPRGNVSFIVDDGRNFLLTTSKRYDLITFEPMPLALAGVSTFYTLEYYELCRDRLAPGGLVSQWVPLHSLNEEVVRSLVRTFVEVFPESTAWFINADLFLIGSNEPLRLNPSKARRRINANAELKAGLDKVYLSDLHEIMAGYFMGGGQLRAFAKDGVIMTDDRPWAEFVAPRLRYENHVQESLLALEAYRESPAALLEQGDFPDAEWAEWLAGLERRREAHASDFQGLKRYYAPFRSTTMEDDFRRSLEIDPQDGNARYYLGEILLSRARISLHYEEYAEALPLLEEALSMAPHRLDVLLALGDAYAGDGDAGHAREYYQRYLDSGGNAEVARSFVSR